MTEIEQLKSEESAAIMAVRDEFAKRRQLLQDSCPHAEEAWRTNYDWWCRERFCVRCGLVLEAD